MQIRRLGYRVKLGMSFAVCRSCRGASKAIASFVCVDVLLVYI